MKQPNNVQPTNRFATKDIEGALMAALDQGLTTVSPKQQTLSEIEIGGMKTGIAIAQRRLSRYRRFLGSKAFFSNSID